MAQGPFLLNLYWESQYFRVVFEITCMEIAERHEVQLTVEGELGALCLDYLSPGWVEFVIFLRNLATLEIGLVGVQKLRFLIARQKLWGVLREPTPPHFLLYFIRISIICYHCLPSLKLKYSIHSSPSNFRKSPFLLTK